MNFMFSWQEQFLTSERETLFLPLEHKIHIFSPPCNILYIIRYNQKTTAHFARANRLQDVAKQRETEDVNNI